MDNTIKFEKLKLNTRTLEDLIPPETGREIAGSVPLVYGAYDSSGVIGIAVFSVPETAPSAARLHYISVKEELRRKEIGKALMKFSSESIKKAGGRFLLFRKVSADPKLLRECFEIGRLLDFDPITEPETLYSYGADQLRKSSFFQEAYAKSKGIKVQIIKDPASPLLGSFNSRGDFGLLSLDENTFDAKYSRFYAEDSFITAGIIGQLFESKLLVLREIQSDRFSGKPFDVLPILLAAALAAGMKEKSVEEFLITLSGLFDRKVLYSLFGEPEQVYRGIDLVRYL